MASALLATVAIILAGCSGGDGAGFVGSATTTPTTPTTTTAVTVAGSINTTAPAPTATSPPPTDPPPTTSRPPAPATTTPSPPACSSLLLAAEAVSEKPTYGPGEIVRIQATLRNKSDVACRYSSYGISNRIDNASGQPVRPAPILTIDTLEENILLPDQTLGSAPTWDQQICSGAAAPCTQAPPGQYRARATWVFAGAPVEGSATFELVA